MDQEALNVCVTGAAGMIGYAFVPLLLTGQCFGDRKINLRLLDIPPMEQVLEGVALEVQDGAYPLLNSITTGSDPLVQFKDLDVGIFIGGFPRKEGMERKDLLQINGKIFKGQGSALNEVAKKTCKVVVVANPANTNCLLLQIGCPNIPAENFTALTRLDQNRAQSQIAAKGNVHSTEVKNVLIWGNHSSTQYPDVNSGTIKGQPIRQTLNDDSYLNGEFIKKVQSRGAEIIKVRKGSSVFSAANAVKDHLKDWFSGTPEGTLTSMAVISKGQYGIPKDICYSFPIKLKGNFQYEVVENLNIDSFSREKMEATAKELIEEKEMATS